VGQPAAIFLDRGGRRLAGTKNGGVVEGFDRQPPRDAVSQQPGGAVAFVQTLRAPVVRNAVGDRSSSARKKPGKRMETRRECAGALRRGCERARDQRNDPEHRFAERERRIAPLKMQALDLGDLDVEKRDRQRSIPRGDLAQRSPSGRSGPERRPKAPHLAGRRRQSVRRPVGQAIVVLVNAGEGRVDRPQAIVALEKRIECGHQASGSETQRRSRKECSTALMTS
jgi:hypothetical protein